MIRLHHCEALSFLENTAERWDTIFMDPPDNIGLGYAQFDDKVPEAHYYNWLKLLILESMLKANVVWISHYWKHSMAVAVMVNSLIQRIKPSWEAKTFIWRFTFGQYRSNDCGSGYRPILRLSKPGVVWQTDKIRVPSVRMELGDSRARGPRVPDDVWEFPRVVGNSPERRSWMPTQHPESLLRRIILMSPGNRVLELFTGSGTMIRVIKGDKNLGAKHLDTVELSSEVISHLVKEHGGVMRDKLPNGSFSSKVTELCT